MRKTLVSFTLLLGVVAGGLGVAGPASAAGGSLAISSARLVPAAAVAGVATRLIEGARGQVELEVYELGNPEVITALEAARRRGVSVRVILDATEYQSERSAQELGAAGVSVEEAHVQGGIDHVKLLVADDAVLMGGVNLGTGSSYTTDLDVELGSPVTAVAAGRVFSADWSAARRGEGYASGTFGPFVTGGAIEPAMEGLLGATRGSCVVVANYLTDYGIQDALVAAARRGVAIEAVLNAGAYGAASARSWLAGHGVRVEMAPSSPYLHAKVLACGGAAILGSANFSHDGMAYNHELDVELVGPAAAAVMAWATGVWKRG